MATKRRNSRQRKSVRRGRRTGGMNLLGFLNPKKKGGEDEEPEVENKAAEAPAVAEEGMLSMFGTKESSAEEEAEEAKEEKEATTTPVEEGVQEGGRRRRRATRRVRRRKVRRTARRVKRRVKRRSSRRRK